MSYRLLLACLLLALVPASAAAAAPPWGLERPTITGTMDLGQQLACSDGKWKYALTAISKRWLRGGQTVGTGGTYAVQAADLGRQVACEVKATSVEAGTMYALSDPFPAPGSARPAPAAPPCGSSTPSETHSPDPLETWVRADDSCSLTVTTRVDAAKLPTLRFFLDIDGDAGTGDSINGGADRLVMITGTGRASLSAWNPGTLRWDTAALQLAVDSAAGGLVSWRAPLASLGLLPGTSARMRVTAGTDVAPAFAFSVAFSSEPPAVIAPPPSTPTSPAGPIAAPGAPQPAKPPRLTRAGKRLRCSAGTWTGAPKLSYGWKRNGRAIKGRSSSSYTVRKADRRKSLTCAVTAKNAAGTLTVTSRPIKIK